MKLPVILMTIFSAILTIQPLTAQEFSPLDKSPCDIVVLRKDDVPRIRLVYSRPQLQKRQVFGKLVPYGKVWRTGANEATIILFYQEVKVDGKTIPAGEYSLFTIPGPEQWTIILNQDADQWGAYAYDEKKDVVRFNVPARKTNKLIENFSMGLIEKPEGAAVILGWENTLVEFPIGF